MLNLVNRHFNANILAYYHAWRVPCLAYCHAWRVPCEPEKGLLSTELNCPVTKALFTFGIVLNLTLLPSVHFVTCSLTNERRLNA